LLNKLSESFARGTTDAEGVRRPFFKCPSCNGSLRLIPVDHPAVPKDDNFKEAIGLFANPEVTQCDACGQFGLTEAMKQ